ncbi:MAG: magnesium transporter [SAR202 cluster bacterium]|nr:magnesium transporter [SAR202 cluster bacterium]
MHQPEIKSPEAAPETQVTDRERIERLIGELTELLSGEDQGPAMALFVSQHPADQAEVLSALPSERQLALLKALRSEETARIMEHLDAEVASRLVEQLEGPRAARVLRETTEDVATDILRRLPEEQSRRILEVMGRPEELLALLKYPDESAGGLMVTEFPSVRADLRAANALDLLGIYGPMAEDIGSLLVVDNAGRLVGLLSVTRLALARPNTRVSQVMNTDVKWVLPTADQEECARIKERYDLSFLPVADENQRPLGIILGDDLVDVLKEEATEDIYRYGTVPETEVSYFKSRLLDVARRRVVWLFLLILVNTVTGSIIASQSDLLEEVVILAAFVPLLIGTGGNVGAQSSTVVIRGIATGEVTRSQAVYVIGREIAVGALLGVALGAIVIGWAFLLGRELDVGFVVGITMVVIAATAAMTGGGLPFLFRWLKLDPALVSAPFITTFMDIIGVGVYFLVAHLVLNL